MCNAKSFTKHKLKIENIVEKSTEVNERHTEFACDSSRSENLENGKKNQGVINGIY